MPVQLASPGVYIQEVSSGVRTIAGVATSVAAFLGAAPRGPINKATRIFSFADFERAFGGLSADSEMSYGVRQFFINGGTDAWDRPHRQERGASQPGRCSTRRPSPY